MADAFGICQTRYIEDPNGHVNKSVVEKLLYNHVSNHHT
jgi:hypothetical protein